MSRLLFLTICFVVCSTVGAPTGPCPAWLTLSTTQLDTSPPMITISMSSLDQNQWLAVGFCNCNQMNGADMIICKRGDTPVCTDRSGKGHFVPTIDPIQNIKFQEAIVSGVWTVTVSRALDTRDTSDYIIPLTMQNVIWAVGLGSTTAQHISQGSFVWSPGMAAITPTPAPSSAPITPGLPPWLNLSANLTTLPNATSAIQPRMAPGDIGLIMGLVIAAFLVLGIVFFVIHTKDRQRTYPRSEEEFREGGLYVQMPSQWHSFSPPIPPSFQTYTPPYPSVLPQPRRMTLQGREQNMWR